MKSILPLFAFVLFTTNVFANQITDQKWSCRVNAAKSRQALNASYRANPGRRDGSRGATPTALTDLEAVSFEIKNGQIVDGQIAAEQGFGESGWRFTEPSPAGRNSQEYTLSQARSSADGKIRFEVSSDGWDHFSYTITLNPAANSATVSDYGYFDCGSPGAGVGVLDCEKK